MFHCTLYYALVFRLCLKAFQSVLGQHHSLYKEILKQIRKDLQTLDRKQVYSDYCCIGSQIHRNFERKIVNISLTISLSICFGCSKELSQ